MATATNDVFIGLLLGGGGVGILTFISKRWGTFISKRWVKAHTLGASGSSTKYKVDTL